MQGHIDSMEGGVLRGWARDPGEESKRLRIAVKCGATTLGFGDADRLRPDLFDADMGDGRYGFAIALSDESRAVAGELLELHDEDGRALATNRFTVAPAGLRAWADMMSIPGGAIRASIAIPDLPDAEHRVTLISNGEILSETRVSIRGGHGHVNLGVPLRYVDGEARTFALGLEGSPHAIGGARLVLDPIATPWRYLKQGTRAYGTASLSGTAGRRYESLLAQMNALGDGTSRLSLADLSDVHSRVVEGWEGRTQFPKMKLPEVVEPDVSIIIPVFNKLELTYHACASIALSHNRASYEVIVVDDASSDRTTEIEEIIENVVVVRNEQNKGFLRSVNTAALSARGKFLIILNNDTEVTSGWIDEMLAIFEDSKVGLVGSKLLNLDGSTQEAGGIVWANGQPWNVGRDTNPWTPEYNYTRDVDYVSGAAMCIPRLLWESIGGFSDELAPAYYEDTDLAFKVREAGRRTVYAPRSEVVHFEGKSNGRDVTKGVKRYQVVNEAKFRKKWFDAYRGNGRVGVDLHIQKDRNIDHRVLVIDYATPDPQRDAGSYAAIREMELFQSLGFKVTFVPRDMAHQGNLTWALQRRGIEVLHAPFYLSPHEVLERRGHEFDVVYITRYDVAESVLEYIRLLTHAKVVFNNADLHFLRMLRAHNVSGNPSMEEVLRVRDAELAIMRGVDAIVSYNELEHAVILSHNLRDDNVFRCPWVVGERPQGPGFEERSGIAFLGGYRHPPNVEGVCHFVSEILPELLEQDPDMILHVYGSNPPAEVLELASSNVRVVGFVESLDEVFHKHRVFVAPLLSGAGLKGKVVESMAYGLPSVLSPVAVEATGLTDGTNTRVATTPQEWVKGILAYYNDEVEWAEARRGVLQLAERRFSLEAARRGWREMLAHVGIYAKSDETDA